MQNNEKNFATYFDSLETVPQSTVLKLIINNNLNTIVFIFNISKSKLVQVGPNNITSDVQPTYSNILRINILKMC